MTDLITTYDSKYKIQEFEFSVGKKLLPGENSSTKLYGLIAKKGDYVLRISLIKEISEIHCDNDSRYLSEVYLRPI